VRLLKAILLRLLFGVLSLIFISFVVFVADELAPGDAATVLSGEKARPEAVAKLRHDLGLDRPWPIRYFEFVGKAARFDFGTSYLGQNRKVTDKIADNLPMTLKIAFSAIILAAIVGISLGVLASLHQNKFIDRAVLSISTLGVTLPNFVLAPLLVFVFAITLDQLPSDYNRSLIERGEPEYLFLLLPIVVLAARPMAMLTRLTRASMIDTMQQEFIRTAIAKGVPTFRLVTKHGLRNAIMPVVTAIGTSFGFLLTGSFVVEIFFRLPGLGREAIEAINARDTPVVQACILITGAMFIIINLLVDMALPILDPRIREAQV
jgi:peptide/nickel transport system permease protein